jgi:8-oxo-dGTP pyrophosphatase MutT (NUDIX family)
VTASEPPPASPPRDSATVLLLRDGRAGLEVFMVRRHGRSAFMANAHVFPGGTVDPQDMEPALWERTRGRSASDAAGALGEEDEGRALGLFCAAVRETFEEAGILLGRLERPAAGVEAARQRLLAGDPLAAVLGSLQALVELDRLVPHSRWITPEVEPRRYDARFFMAVAPPDQTARHDQVETTAGVWLEPRVAIERERAGQIHLPPPTLRTLEAIAGHPSSDAALAEAAARRPPTIAPVFREMGGQVVLCLPGDPGHPVAEPGLPGPTRLVLEEGRWWSRHAPRE